MRARELSISSVSPSEKYSCSLSPLIFTNGSTAIECGGGAKAVGAALAGAAGGVGGDAGFLWIQNSSMPKEASAPATTTARTIGSACFDRQGVATRSLVSGVAADPRAAGKAVVVGP